VTGPYATAIIVVALALAAWALVLVVANRAPGLSLQIGAAVLEAMLLGFLVGGIVQMVRSSHDFARAEFVGYLLGCVVIPPLAVGWAWAERSRSGTAVLAIAFLVMPVMVLRVQQVWAGPVG
jgi:hypothetical protein